MIKLKPRMRDLTGLTFGQLTALTPVKLNEKNQVYWEFKCTCGNIVTLLGNSVTARAKKDSTGLLPSCGCVRSNVCAAKAFKHGFSKHKLEGVYYAMRRRCYDPKCKDYSAYGGVGVTICDEWLKDPSAFYTWAINNGWQEGYHIDKDIINKSLKQYSPQTCSIVPAEINLKHSRKG